MSAAEFRPTAIPEVVEILPRVFRDQRGFFLESWNQETFEAGGLRAVFVQDNHSRSLRGTLRGLHYQVKQPQGKLVRVVAGEVFDVAVDLRRSSPHFGKWVAVLLSEERNNLIWIPPGFAHGFYVTSSSADLLYKCTSFYSPADDRTIRWNDRSLAIDWPLATDRDPLVSQKDAAGVDFEVAETFP